MARREIGCQPPAVQTGGKSGKQKAEKGGTDGKPDEFKPDEFIDRLDQPHQRVVDDQVRQWRGQSNDYGQRSGAAKCEQRRRVLPGKNQCRVNFPATVVTGISRFAPFSILARFLRFVLHSPHSDEDFDPANATPKSGLRPRGKKRLKKVV
jgi:hypothetical protein